MDENIGSKRATADHGSRRALILLFGGTGALGLLALLWPPISGWLQALLALMLLTIPTLVLKGSGKTIDDYGVSLGPTAKTLLIAAMVMGCVTPLYILGFHLVHGELRERPVTWSWSNASRWDEDVREMPSEVCAQRNGERAIVWTSRDALWILGPPDAELTLTADVAPTHRPTNARCGTAGRVRASGALGAPGDVSWVAPRGTGFRLSLQDLSSFGGQIRIDGEPARLQVGAFAQGRDTEGRLDISRDLWWVITFIIVHLGLIALPEEWFFRGYLQGRLNERFGTPWRWFGVSVGPGLLWSSLAFALLHPILIPGFHRLLVFFPSLLFGWLRERTGNIGAAVVVHAACNLLQAITAGMYG